MMKLINRRISNRLLVATAIALGSGAVFSNPARSITLSYGTYGLTNTQLSQWSVSGEVILLETDITLDSAIAYSTCPQGRIQSRVHPPNRNLLVSSTSRAPSNKITCRPVSREETPTAISNATDTVNFNRATNRFSGNLVINGSVAKSSRVRGNVKASSQAKINITTRAVDHFGSVNAAPFYGFRQLPETQNTAKSNTTKVTAFLKDITTGVILRQQDLFKTTTSILSSNIPGGISWDSDSIDFVGVQRGSFNIVFGSWTDKPGNLLVEFLDGKVSRVEDSGFFNNWLPGVGTPGNFSLKLDPPRISNFNFDYSYNVPGVGRKTDLVLAGDLQAEVIPEPMTIVGTLTALSLGIYFKKRYRS